MKKIKNAGKITLNSKGLCMNNNFILLPEHLPVYI